jgi:hypothetical protein
METATVGVRLRGDVWARYSAEAQALGVSMGRTYLRRRLEEQDRIAASLDALRAAFAAMAVPQAATLPPQIQGTLVELLYLLRTIAGPQNTRMVHSEVTRLGLEAWP